MLQLAGRGRHDPGRRLELGDGQLGLAVRALLQRELVLQRGQPHLAVGQEGLPDDDGQQRGHHHRDGHDGEEPSPTGGGAAPSMPRRAASGTTRSGARRVEGASAPRPARRGRARCRRRRGGGWRPPWLRKEAPSGRSVLRTRPRARSARWPAGGRSRRAGWPRPPPPTACGRPRKTSWWRTTAPQTHGRPGGQTHPPEAASAKVCFVRRSSPGVVADHRAHAPDRQVRQGDRQRGLELAQLVVHLDPQGLEDPAGRVALPAGRRRHRRRHDFGQLPRRGQWPGPHDGPGDAPGQPALSVLTEQRRQVLDREGVHQVGGRGPGGRVHPHVERPVLAEREPPLGPVELGGADAQVEEHARQGPEPGTGETPTPTRRTGPRSSVTRSPKADNRCPGRLERRRVAVQPDDAQVCDTPRATPRRARPLRRSRRRPRRGARMRTARPLRRAARECVRTSGPSAAPRPVGREGGGDPDDQRGGGWSGLPARRSRSCTWSSAFLRVLVLSCSGSCGESSLLLPVVVVVVCCRCRIGPVVDRRCR